MAKFIKLNNGSYVNIDDIRSINPRGERAVILFKLQGTLDIDKSDMENIVAESKKKDASEFSSVMNKLITAVERLTVRIPSSIRLHM